MPRAWLVYTPRPPAARKIRVSIKPHRLTENVNSDLSQHMPGLVLREVAIARRSHAMHASPQHFPRAERTQHVPRLLRTLRKQELEVEHRQQPRSRARKVYEETRASTSEHGEHEQSMGGSTSYRPEVRVPYQRQHCSPKAAAPLPCTKVAIHASAALLES